jgi:two-component system, OmpR family, sensor histidine kinase MprB
MTFRARIAISAAAAVAVTVVVASVVLYLVAREQLRAPVDDALEAKAAAVSHQPLRVINGPEGKTYLAIRPEFGEAGGYVQLVRTDGTVITPFLQNVELPVDEAVLAAATRQSGASIWQDVNVDGTRLRMLTFAYGPDAVLQVARPLTEVDQSLSRIGLFLLLIAASGIVVAAALGLLVARAALAPVKRLTSTVERVTETQDLSERIEVAGDDELNRLAASFNTMLAALAADAIDECPNEHRGARRRSLASARGPSTPPVGRRRATRRDDDADLRTDRARASGAASDGAGGGPARPARRRRGRARAA